MQELTLMYNWCRKMRDTFDEIAESYEQYAKSKGIVTYKSKNKKQSIKTKKRQKTKLNYQRQESSSQEIKPKALNLSTVLPTIPIKNNKQSYDYKYRIAALRKLGQKAEEEMDEEQENKKVETKRKNSAFFLFVREKRNSIKEEYPELGTRQVAKILAEVWKNMSEPQRNAYENQNKNIRTDFDRKFKKYLQGIVKLQSKRSREANQGETDKDD